jgi:hypothetical protein
LTLFTPLYMQAAEGDTPVVYNGLDLRLGLTGLWASEGVTSAAAFKVTQRAAGANLSVDVAGGIAVVTGNDVNIQGAYMCASDAVENLTIPAPPVSGSRTHRVILWVKDKLYDGTLPANTYEFVLEVQEDTGSGAPDLPDSAIPLALVTVDAGQVSVLDGDIVDSRISAMTTNSWARQVGADTDRPAIPLPGEKIWRTDLDLYEVWDGSAWRVLGPPPAATSFTEGTDLTGITGTGFAAGSPACATTFTAPPSGGVFVTVTGRLAQSINGNQTILGWEIRTGAVIGSGTVVVSASDDLALITSRPVNSGASSYLAASHRSPLFGLTPGTTYNIRTMHRVTGGSGALERRALIVEPAP